MAEKMATGYCQQKPEKYSNGLDISEAFQTTENLSGKTLAFLCSPLKQGRTSSTGGMKSDSTAVPMPRSSISMYQTVFFNNV